MSVRAALLLTGLTACGFDTRIAGVVDAADEAEAGAVDAAVDAAETACGNCDDGDPCTADACVGTQCVNTLATVPAGCGGGTLQRCVGQPTCYLRCTTPLAWTAAEQSCVAWSGHLVTVTSDAETACVDAWLTNQGWIGYFQDANDPEPDGGWEWTSTSTSTYVNWVPPQPNNNVDVLPGGQDCAYVEGAQQGKWFDHECTQPYPYICER